MCTLRKVIILKLFIVVSVVVFLSLLFLVTAVFSVDFSLHLPIAPDKLYVILLVCPCFETYTGDLFYSSYCVFYGLTVA